MYLKQYEFLNPNVRGLFVHWQSPIKICIQLWKHGFVSKSMVVSPWKKVGGLQGKSEKRSGAFASNNTIPACIHDVHRIYYSYGTEPITITRKLLVNTEWLPSNYSYLYLYSFVVFLLRQKTNLAIFQRNCFTLVLRILITIIPACF